MDTAEWRHGRWGAGTLGLRLLSSFGSLQFPGSEEQSGKWPTGVCLRPMSCSDQPGVPSSPESQLLRTMTPRATGMPGHPADVPPRLPLWLPGNPAQSRIPARLQKPSRPGPARSRAECPAHTPAVCPCRGHAPLPTTARRPALRVQPKSTCSGERRTRRVTLCGSGQIFPPRFPGGHSCEDFPDFSGKNLLDTNSQAPSQTH